MAETTEVITLRVPKGTKESMKRLHVNWSEDIREHIQDRVRAAKLLNLLKGLRKSSKKIQIQGDSTSIIRHYRDIR
jgi:hypothetical protein